MPDHLTPAERAAIEAYTGTVQIIPRGVSGLPAPWEAVSWKAQIKANFDQGKAVKAALARKRADAVAHIQPMKVRDGETRDDAIRRFAADGWTTREIGNFFGVSHVTAHKALKRAA